MPEMSVRERIAKMIWEFHYKGKIIKWESREQREKEYELSKADSILSAVLAEVPKDMDLSKKDSNNNRYFIRGRNNALAEIREILKGVER
jgi:hypothetical protein